MKKHIGKEIISNLKETKLLVDKCLKNKISIGNFTMPQMLIILNLAENKKMKISDLSENIGLTNSTVSGIVDRLEEQSVVERTRSTTDRRVVHVELTPKYSNLHYELNDNIDKYMDEIFSEVTIEQLENTMENLNTLKKALQNHLTSTK